MTGLATGPHLDYRMIKSGVFVNPLQMQSPPADPIAAEERAAFEAARARQIAMLGPSSAAAPAPAAAADAARALSAVAPLPAVTTSAP